MKKKLLIFAALLLSIAISFAVGVLAFSADNINNAASGLQCESYTPDGGLKLYGFTKDESGAYISAEDSQLVLENIGAVVSTVRFSGSFDERLVSENELRGVEAFYTESAGEEFSEGKKLLVPISRKNDDIYFLVGDALAAAGKEGAVLNSLRFDIYSEAGLKAEIYGLELNPRKLNCNFAGLILALVIPFAIGYSVIEMVYDRKSLKKDIFAMKRYKYLLWDLVTRDIKTKYRRSLLGILWSVLNPLLMMLVLTAIFSNILRVEVEGGFALFYLTGYIIFNFISEATGFSLYTITSAGPLIKKVYVPKYIFPLEKCIFSFVNMIFSMIAFVIVFTVFAIMGKVTVSPTMLLFPIPLILAFIFCLGLCFVLSSLLVFFRDIGHLWGIFLTVWMYATPIIYPMSMVPSWLASIIRLNPLYYYVEFFRGIMIYGRLPSAADFAVSALAAVAMLFVGICVFRKKQDKFILYI